MVIQAGELVWNFIEIYLIIRMKNDSLEMKSFPSDVIVFFSGYVSFSQLQLVGKTGGMHHIHPLIPSMSLGFCLLIR